MFVFVTDPFLSCRLMRDNFLETGYLMKKPCFTCILLLDMLGLVNLKVLINFESKFVSTYI